MREPPSDDLSGLYDGVCLAKAARNRIGSARKPKFFGKLASSFEQHRRDFRVDRFVG